MQYQWSIIGSVINGWFKAYLAENLALGSIFKHLLKKSKKFLLLDCTLLCKFVNFGLYILENPVFLFFLLPYSPIYSCTSSNSTISFVKYFVDHCPNIFILSHIWIWPPPPLNRPLNMTTIPHLFYGLFDQVFTMLSLEHCS